MHPDNEDAYDVHVLRCFACTAKAQTARGFTDDAGGMYFAASLPADHDDGE